MVAVRNSTHYGIAGYYPLMAIENDMIGITGTNARPSIAPTFGVENMLGTNPLTFGMPSDEEFPFFLDCATSVSQRGKLEVYDRAGKDIPPGWVIGRRRKKPVPTRIRSLMIWSKGRQLLLRWAESARKEPVIKATVTPRLLRFYRRHCSRDRL